MVVVAGAGCERDGRQAVRDLGFSCYQPVLRLQVVRRGRKVWVERLLFGRYFFARDAAALDWRAIPGLRQITEIFMAPPPYADAGAEPTLPALVDDCEVDAIRAMEDRHGCVVFDGADRNQFVRHQAVRAVAGVFAGHAGRYDGYRRGVDAAYLMIFGRETRIEFAPGALAAA